MWNDELSWHVFQHTIPAALSLLPGRMDSPGARAMLLATAGQESEYRHRTQVVKPGVPPPAMGLWQFERGGGVAEILQHFPTIINPILRTFLIAPKAASVHPALAYQDVIACVFARLLLYRDPRPMPTRTQSSIGWSIYVKNWRPGKPHEDKWPGNFAEAWRIVEGR